MKNEKGIILNTRGCHVEVRSMLKFSDLIGSRFLSDFLLLSMESEFM